MTDYRWLFARIGELLDDWDRDIPLASIPSLNALVRFLDIWEPAARPSIGAHCIDGRLSASWLSGDRRLTLYFGDDGRAQCVFSWLEADGARSVATVECLPDTMHEHLPDHVMALLSGDLAAAA